MERTKPNNNSIKNKSSKTTELEACQAVKTEQNMKIEMQTKNKQLNGSYCKMEGEKFVSIVYERV